MANPPESEQRVEGALGFMCCSNSDEYLFLPPTPLTRWLAADGGQDPPPPKRKKTVTWAGDVPDTSAENEGPQSSAEDPAVIVVEQGPQDSLFAGLGDLLVDHQG
jgi:hypothetical protein